MCVWSSSAHQDRPHPAGWAGKLHAAQDPRPDRTEHSAGEHPVAPGPLPGLGTWLLGGGAARWQTAHRHRTGRDRRGVDPRSVLDRLLSQLRTEIDAARARCRRPPGAPGPPRRPARPPRQRVRRRRGPAAAVQQRRRVLVHGKLVRRARRQQPKQASPRPLPRRIQPAGIQQARAGQVVAAQNVVGLRARQLVASRCARKPQA